MRILLLFVVTSIAFSASATKMVNSCEHVIAAKRIDGGGRSGYKVTIDGKATLHEHYMGTNPSASNDVLKEVAKRSPVIFGRPSFVRFDISSRCPGSRSKEIIEAHVQSSNEEYRLCFELQANGDFYLATDFRD